MGLRSPPAFGHEDTRSDQMRDHERYNHPLPLDEDHWNRTGGEIRHWEEAHENGGIPHMRADDDEYYMEPYGFEEGYDYGD